jgi:hypothetical protein
MGDCAVARRTTELDELRDSLRTLGWRGPWDGTAPGDEEYGSSAASID